MTASRASVLFLCTGNSARSQMAEAILRQMSKGEIDVYSAGSRPQEKIHSMAREAVRTLFNLELSGQEPKSVQRFSGRSFDYVITVCDRAAEECPVFPGEAQRIHWGFDDPAAAGGSADDQQRVFDRVATEITARLRLWMALPAVSSRLSVASRA
jgi:arsenate reductase